MRFNPNDVPDQNGRMERMIRRKFEEQKITSELVKKNEREKAELHLRTTLLFCLWFILNKELERLEKLRDENLPTDLCEEWNEDFCMAIRKIPEVESLCEDVWFFYINFERG